MCVEGGRGVSRLQGRCGDVVTPAGFLARSGSVCEEEIAPRVCYMLLYRIDSAVL